MQKIARRALVASGVALLYFTAQAWAQEPMRVRGTVEGQKTTGAFMELKSPTDTTLVIGADKLFVDRIREQSPSVAVLLGLVI